MTRLSIASQLTAITLQIPQRKEVEISVKRLTAAVESALNSDGSASKERDGPQSSLRVPPSAVPGSEARYEPSNLGSLTSLLIRGLQPRTPTLREKTNRPVSAPPLSPPPLS